MPKKPFPGGQKFQPIFSLRMSLLWQDELNPRVRCAFGNVLFIQGEPVCPSVLCWPLGNALFSPTQLQFHLWASEESIYKDNPELYKQKKRLELSLTSSSQGKTSVKKNCYNPVGN